MDQRMIGVPSWSDDGLSSRDIFFGVFNDVDFYVEDEEQENLYLEIFGKLFSNLRIDQIFPLGGKINVISHANDEINSRNGRVLIYVVDKDFDDLLGAKVSNKNVFYLSKYCIENFLIEEDSLIEVAVEAQPKKKRAVISEELGFAQFIDEIIADLDLLFRLFFLVQKFDLGLKNCNCSPEYFSIKNKPYKLDREKIFSYKSSVLGALINERGEFESEEDVFLFLNDVFPPASLGGVDSNISGKFILAMTMHYLKNKMKCGNISLDSLAFRLAKNSNLEGLSMLRNQIQEYLNLNMRDSQVA